MPIVSAGDGGTIAVTLSDGNGKTQTLILPTPTGLPGVPVASGGNYTDQNGQLWICDEVDLERGVKVQRVKSVDISSLDKSFWVFRNDIDANVSATRYSNKAVIIDFGANPPAMSNILPTGVRNVEKTIREIHKCGYTQDGGLSHSTAVPRDQYGCNGYCIFRGTA